MFYIKGLNNNRNKAPNNSNNNKKLGVFYKYWISYLSEMCSYLTFNGSSQIGFSNIIVLDEEGAVLIALTDALCEDSNVAFHHLHWTAMFHVHPDESICFDKCMIKP